MSAIFAYERITFEGINTPDSKSGNSYSLLGGFKYRYNKTGSNVILYGRLDAGILILQNSSKWANQQDGENTGAIFACQVSPVCIRFGQRIGGFIEFGSAA